MSFYLALFTKLFNDKSLALRLTVFPLTAPFVAIPLTYVCGLLLDRYYETYRIACDQMSETKDSHELLLHREAWEKASFQTLYVFYVFTGLVAVACLVLNMIYMKDQDQSDHGWWILSIVIAVAFELLVLDVIWVQLASKTDVVFNIGRKKGYYYEKELHDDVQTFIGDK